MEVTADLGISPRRRIWSNIGGMTESFMAFLGVSILVIVTPGPDTAVTVRNALLGGRGAGVFTALGVAIGQAIWALATSLGIVALLVASEQIFFAVKLAGAAYLVFLGAQALWAAWRWKRPLAAGRRPQRRQAPWKAFRRGLISDLSNPKMAAFFASLLPQFIPESGPDFASLMLLGMVFSALTFVWLALYAHAIATAGDFMRRPGIRRALGAIMGAGLVALGLRVAAER